MAASAAQSNVSREVRLARMPAMDALTDFWRNLIIRVERSPLTQIILALAFTGGMIACAASITTRTQIAVACTAIVAFLVLKRFNTIETVRVLFLVIAAFLSLDYFYWRTFTTLGFNDTLSFTCAILLYLAEVYGFIVYILSIFVNVDPLDRQPLPLPADKKSLPTVDVMIPSFNEDPELLEVTLLSSLQMDYPPDKFTVYLLDDGGTDQRCNVEDPALANAARQRRRELAALCERVGAVYITRAKNIRAKAGNINNGLEHSHGDLIMVLDADHAPTSDFLQNTVGWFIKDPKMFLVQTPHFFINPDPIEKNLQTFHQMPGENEMFYRVIQKGLDYWNSAFFCGSAAVLRRKYLMQIGGISGDTITEDAETALALHSKGYNSAYIGRPMISGLSPETLGGFVGQRIRWAQGMVQIFLLKNPLLIKGLTLPQRLCYFSSCFFWFFAYARVVFMLAPLCFLFFGLKIYNANFVDFAAYCLPHLFAVFMVSDFLFGHVRWSFVSELYELMQSLYTLPAIGKVFLNPHAPSFNVTAKGETLNQDFISPLSKPFYFLLFLNLIALAFGAFRLFAYPGDRFPTTVTMCWAAFNIFILLAAMGALLERRQRRATPRMPSEVPVKVRLGEKAYVGVLKDLSVSGASIEIDAAYESLFHNDTKADFLIQSPAHLAGQDLNFVVRNSRTQGGILIMGVQFQHKDLEELKRKVLLVTGSSQRWLDFQIGRERRLGVMRSAFFLMTCGVRFSIEHFAHMMIESNLRQPAPAYQAGGTSRKNL